MKRILILAVICLAAVSCSQTFKVDGTVSNEKALQGGYIVIAANHNARTMDTLAITDGKFHFEAPASDTTRYTFLLTNPVHRNKKISSVKCIAEKGVTKVVLGEEQEGEILAAGKLTIMLNEMDNACNAIFNKYPATLDSLKLKYGEDTPQYREAAIAAKSETYKNADSICLFYFKDNKDNALGLAALKNIASDLSLEELEDLIADAAPFIKNNPSITKVHNDLQRKKLTEEGAMFVDFEGKSPEGDVSRLSDFVGRGKYTLVDFWASWCGPCRQKMPEIKELYEKYSSKGLVVLGVDTVESDRANGINALAELGMAWPQIFLEDQTALTQYGISFIPHTILFAPDGTIYKRNAQGEELKTIIEEIFK